MKILNKISGSFVVSTMVIALGLVGPTTVLAATTPSLGTAAPYGVLGTTFTRNVGLTAITGDLGYTTLSGSGTHSVSGSTVVVPPGQAGIDQGAALADLNGQSCTSLGTNVLLAGTYTPGCYSSSGSMDIAVGTTVTLSGTGTFIFRPDAAITTGANSIVALANGAASCDVFWTPNGDATLGANSTFKGTVIPVSQDIYVGNLANWNGRALTFGHTVTTDTAVIDSTCTTAAAAAGGTRRDQTITVVKTVINDNNGTKTVADFSLFVNGAAVVSGVGTNLSAGTFTVTETSDPGYIRTFSGDCDSAGQVILNSGDNKFCIVTNNDIGSPVIPPVPPLIDVVKVPSPLSLAVGGDPVTYTFTLRNIGTVPVTNITMVDDSCSPITLVSGDTNGDAILQVNETWVHTCSTILMATHTNTVVATGQANGITATDIASATVIVGVPGLPDTGFVSPLIHVTKIPSPLTLLAGGGMVTYTERVTNPGTIPLSNVGLTDDKCSPVQYVSGDSNGDSMLQPSETWIYTCTANLTSSTTNTATAIGTGNGLVATDIAIATVLVAVPGFPNTGLSPATSLTVWYVISAGILTLALLAYAIRKKQIA